MEEHEGKALVRRLIDEVMNDGRLDVLDELYTPAMAAAARRWIAPFRATFPDVRMEVVQLVAEGDTVVGRFRCSATHLGEWRGQPPTGRSFRNVDEVLPLPRAPRGTRGAGAGGTALGSSIV